LPNHVAIETFAPLLESASEIPVANEITTQTPRKSFAPLRTDSTKCSSLCQNITPIINVATKKMKAISAKYHEPMLPILLMNGKTVDIQLLNCSNPSHPVIFCQLTIPIIIIKKHKENIINVTLRFKVNSGIIASVNLKCSKLAFLCS
jgi:hypothetical protein